MASTDGEHVVVKDSTTEKTDADPWLAKTLLDKSLLKKSISVGIPLFIASVAIF